MYVKTALKRLKACTCICLSLLLVNQMYVIPSCLIYMCIVLNLNIWTNKCLNSIWILSFYWICFTSTSIYSAHSKHLQLTCNPSNRCFRSILTLHNHTINQGHPGSGEDIKRYANKQWQCKHTMQWQQSHKCITFFHTNLL